jgi:RNA-directed DNA polymerase
LKLVLEPIFEADFLPCSYGFRPNRRAHDAVAEVHHFASRSYEWIVEGDIKACFDEISHSALVERVRNRVADKRVLALVKAFLKAGILTEDGTLAETDAGTPQGSILSPLLSNVALSVLDEHIAQAPGGPAASPYQRAKRRRQGLPNYRLCRYADDWCLVVSGTRQHAEALREEIAGVLSTMGLRLSPEKTLITHIDKGLDFLGWRIQRHHQRGTGRYYVYVYPAKKALVAVMAKVKTIFRQNTNLQLEDLLHQLNRMLRGWTTYFKYGCPTRPSAICGPTCGNRSSDGKSASIGALRGRSYADATADGPPTVTWSCSTRPGCAPRATTTGGHASKHPGRAQHEANHETLRAVWRARCA